MLQAHAETKYCGDVNQDGNINLKDVTQLKRLLSVEDTSASTDVKTMDVNSDGVVNLKDITYFNWFFMAIKVAIVALFVAFCLNSLFYRSKMHRLMLKFRK